MPGSLYRPGRRPTTEGDHVRHLSAPLRVGPVTLPNRVVFPAHLTNYAVDGRFTERHAAYYAARAARSEEHTSELQSRQYLVCRLLLEKKKRPCSSYTPRSSTL